MRPRSMFAGVLVLAAFNPSVSSAAIALFGYKCCYQMVPRSMQPTINPGDLFGIYLYASGETPPMGDPVVFALSKDPEALHVTRVVGLPGDHVQMIKGALYLNGAAVKRERVDDYVATEENESIRVKRWRETLPNGASYETLDIVDEGVFDNTPEFVVPPGQYFMLGDNRDNSLDSRAKEFGFIPQAAIVGRLVRP